MARGSGLRSVVKIVKAIDRAQKQTVRDAERERKQQEREEAKRLREYERTLKQETKEQAIFEKLQIAEAKNKFKKELEIAKKTFEKRCIERQSLRNDFVDLELR